MAHFLRILSAGLAMGAAALLPAQAASGNLVGAGGAARGTVTVTPAPHGVILRVEATGLTPGWHGMHFHEKGACSDAKFASAGAHVHAATPVTHGFLNANANDAGDLPNIHAGQDGSATAEFYSTLVSMTGEGGRPALLDADGAALVIHANPDDYSTQPIGGAGDRVACGVIR
jgi:Cu-Zn family superoxide dismutase